MASYLADTNLLLRLADPASEQHKVVTQALARLLSQGDEVYVTPQNFIEFWAVATRPLEANGFGWTSHRTAKEVTDLRDRFVDLVREIPGDDRPDYWIGAVPVPIRWLVDNHERLVTHLVLAARWEGTRLERGIRAVGGFLD